VGRANESQEGNEQLEFFSAKGDTQCMLCSSGSRRLKKQHGGSG
jgi:hypothetical protein